MKSPSTKPEWVILSYLCILSMIPCSSIGQFIIIIWDSTIDNNIQWFGIMKVI